MSLGLQSQFDHSSLSCEDHVGAGVNADEVHAEYHDYLRTMEKSELESHHNVCLGIRPNFLYIGEALALVAVRCNKGYARLKSPLLELVDMARKNPNGSVVSKSF